MIVYRLDRISRSVLDFASVIDVFQKHGVDFVSTMEKFDTGTPIGKAMLMIVMIFAQLERETIQQRVIDAYSSRSKRGFYMGGKVPYGFRLKETVIDGIRTKMYEPVPKETAIIEQIFSMYAQPQTSFGDIVRWLDERQVKKRNGEPFSRSRIRDLVVNPVYVRADYRLYEFYKAQGTIIENRPEDFIGTNGAYLYSGNERKRKTISLQGHTLVLAPHEGLIPSDIWIKCRSKCLSNTRVAKPIKAKATWLAGKVKCAHCGYALSAKVYHCKTKADNRYYLCNNKYNTGGCNFGSLDADLVDEIVFEEMRKKLAEFNTLTKQKQESCDLQTIKLKTQIEVIDQEIGSLLDKIPLANGTVMEYINNRITVLDTEKKELLILQFCVRDREDLASGFSNFVHISSILIPRSYRRQSIATRIVFLMSYVATREIGIDLYVTSLTNDLWKENLISAGGEVDDNGDIQIFYQPFLDYNQDKLSYPANHVYI